MCKVRNNANPIIIIPVRKLVFNYARSSWTYSYIKCNCMVVENWSTGVYVHACIRTYAHTYIHTVAWPLPCNDLEMGDYIRPVSGQRLGKHVPMATSTHATWELGVVYAVHAEELKELWQPVGSWAREGRLRRDGAIVELTSSAQVAVTRTWASEDEESPLLEAVARERLVKTQQAG
jgi:hypothetical protein